MELGLIFCGQMPAFDLRLRLLDSTTNSIYYASTIRRSLAQILLSLGLRSPPSEETSS